MSVIGLKECSLAIQLNFESEDDVTFRGFVGGINSCPDRELPTPLISGLPGPAGAFSADVYWLGRGFCMMIGQA